MTNLRRRLCLAILYKLSRSESESQIDVITPSSTASVVYTIIWHMYIAERAVRRRPPVHILCFSLTHEVLVFMTECVSASNRSEWGVCKHSHGFASMPDKSQKSDVYVLGSHRDGYAWMLKKYAPVQRLRLTRTSNNCCLFETTAKIIVCRHLWSSL